MFDKIYKIMRPINLARLSSVQKLNATQFSRQLSSLPYYDTQEEDVSLRKDFPQFNKFVSIDT